jgi:tRNA(Arg) A34 adenosine deaminase TadA
MHIDKINVLRNKAKKLLADKYNAQNLVSLVLDKNFRIIGVGFNSYTKSSTYQQRIANRVNKKESIYLHSEIHAILKTRRRQGKFIFVARKLKSGELGNSKPCEICTLAIREAGIKTVIYTESETKTVIEKIT